MDIMIKQTKGGTMEVGIISMDEEKGVLVIKVVDVLGDERLGFEEILEI